jgi:hypothetical protein
MVHRNFTRFYDTKLPQNSQKETYAGGSRNVCNAIKKEINN